MAWCPWVVTSLGDDPFLSVVRIFDKGVESQVS